jgi:hypothetical protein
MNFIITILQAVKAAYDAALSRVASHLSAKVFKDVKETQVHNVLHCILPVAMLVMFFFAAKVIVPVIYVLCFGLVFNAAIMSALDKIEKVVLFSKHQTA